MATLIICPVCETRYETQAVFPPEGRKVRCSKCAHVWQALPVTAPVEPAAQMAPFPQQAAPPPPPQPAPAVNVAMRRFASIAPVAPPPPPGPGFTPAGTDADLAAQVAQINAEAMAEAPTAAPEAEKRGGGIFARLSRKAAPAPSAPPVDASMDEGTMADATMAEFGMGDAEMGIDPALAAQAFPEEAPRRKPNIVTIGWLVLALIVASVIGTLVLAPSAVMSVLPGAARLYALFGAPVGSEGLAFEGVRYGWTGEGGQTVLEVQGNVVNLTSSPVDVPTVVIALRDEKGEEISEWTTEIGEEELGAGEHAPFLRQIPAPPSNVRSVKVRFAKA
ncbi:MAG: zinc-ribbon domain-containing protein, partial [Methyloceanibacter sp.]